MRIEVRREDSRRAIKELGLKMGVQVMDRHLCIQPTCLAGELYYMPYLFFNKPVKHDEDSVSRFIEEKHPHRPEKESFYRELYLDIEQVKATGPHQVTFTLREPSAVFMQKLAMFPVGIVSPTAVKKFGKDFRRNSNREAGT